MRHLFIVNPIAGGKDRTPEVRSRVEAAFRTRQEPYEIYVTRAPMDAADKIRIEAGKGEPLRVYACGGDGTFNECVCGAARHPHVAVCPFPIGTGNDFCRMFGEEKDLYRDLDAVLDGWETPIDLIDCNGRYSANICSVGIDARIGTDVHSYTHLPLMSGPGAYVASAAVNVFRGIATAMHIRCGDFDRRDQFSLACACNGRFYGGGFNPSKDARPDDGLLDFYIVRKVNLVQLAALIGKYAKGQADRYPKFITHLRGESIQIAFEKEDVVNLDGEALYATEVTMRLVPRALNLVVPRGMRFFGDPPADGAAQQDS
ncbi:MAG: YegS/Rv2252/BmrU family lipid kinase [Oscillospiraceae bacterium]|nr:YegS/Rv2252/BmrU family lipid kinase [Oscillospiraceae bacterium]